MSKNVLTPYVKALLNDPPTLTPSDLSKALKLIFNSEASDIQSSAFLTALRLKGLDHKAEYIAIAVQTVLEFSDLILPNSVDSNGFLDIVGTGGDSQNTFNVSTSAAIIASGIVDSNGEHLKVCKHGGKASTSTSGSGDLMANLGVELFKVNSKTAPLIVKNSNLCFLFAPAFHHGMGKVAHIRAQLGIPTIFNILGPLLNPIPIKARVLGVYAENLGQVYAEAALSIDKSKNPDKIASTLVVWGECGLDEISPIGKTKYWKVDPISKEITTGTLQPSDFGLPEHSLDSVRSGTAKENAEVLKKLLNGEYGVEPNSHPLVDYILINASALAVTAGAAKDWKHGVQLARESITSGNATKALQSFINAINSLE
ncbi:hypothetical protein B5S28_g1995 [[Candida] boidinii]|nr:hypothetical protein B5S28_g1995 [[Candida] boidinii]OWB61657.1 hypothetical protein B5S29_g2556 [[Candida] boidinii]OWB72214.1 hypothetical protein B5S31_g1921 [[Candida] boidinii]OWB78466.1 hypothetical protein B5S32_g2660 [[Candida] boidinii]GME92232.1 unnamed protein product [[Candida] boidinii]